MKSCFLKSPFYLKHNGGYSRNVHLNRPLWIVVICLDLLKKKMFLFLLFYFCFGKLNQIL